jgi:hypothetical protein
MDYPHIGPYRATTRVRNMVAYILQNVGRIKHSKKLYKIRINIK